MSTKSVGRPKEGNPEETRRAILRAAVDNFAQSGFVGATTRNVAVQAGVNVATLHYHFGSKEGLYRAVWKDAIKEKPAVNGVGLPEKERLLHVVSAILEYSAARPWLSRLALQHLLSPVLASEDFPTDPRVTILRDVLGPRTAIGKTPFEGARTPEDLAQWLVTLVDTTLVSMSRGDSADQEKGQPLAGREAIARSVMEQARRVLEAAAITLAEPVEKPGSGRREVA
jgi:AcrR family transcriptional regulator